MEIVVVEGREVRHDVLVVDHTVNLPKHHTVHVFCDVFVADSRRTERVDTAHLLRKGIRQIECCV